ncbi:MAG: lytic transglycosylase domain-containing protein [Saprospiraceae bacterium]|nr:lytic transglycosylase domain-containing protein [Saprospiraceae bacterium]MCB0543055.1 lytic transglycosylase domain-containing protein [Saprospiraceae bacterium]MCB0576625.1 lytic transglycosylase domain-containing protein [Saprospiraceae bacterium]MCB9306311.1 lytic transglycosylase domain-containing protein [Lewinellaceae bacterium]MCB9353756.1 lytic transglycosylase domain-containing protein [Lewinellaceae bacterium]
MGQNKNLRILLLVNVFLVTVLGLFFVSSFKGDDDKKAASSPEQVIRSISLEKDFDFCGEKLPMDNWDVRQRLDAELLRNVYFHSQTILSVKRANAMFPVIEPILKEEGVPDDLKYLAVAESTLSNAISPAGARGVWQFMKSAALGYGLEVNGEVDERYHLEKATRAACAYLRKEKARLGSWTLAAAAYNGGPERIATEMEKQRAQNFYELNLAADETMRYPFRIVAIKEVMSHPELYEYAIEEDHLYEPINDYKTVTVDGPVGNWGDFARSHGTNYRMLKVYNPWLVDSKLTNKAGKVYRIKLPK